MAVRGKHSEAQKAQEAHCAALGFCASEAQKAQHKHTPYRVCLLCLVLGHRSDNLLCSEQAGKFRRGQDRGLTCAVPVGAPDSEVSRS
jgi:hypothetical protein